MLVLLILRLTWRSTGARLFGALCILSFREPRPVSFTFGGRPRPDGVPTMAIEPQVFICYGRPDMVTAHVLTHEFLDEQDRMLQLLGEAEMDHRVFLATCRRFGHPVQKSESMLGKPPSSP